MIGELLAGPVRVVNLGLESFARDLAARGAPVAQVDWRPPGGGKPDGMPFAPKKYTFKKGTGDANVMVTFGPKVTLGDPNGTVDITTFDKKRIAGTIDLSGKLVPGGGAVTLKGKFDFACPGFQNCEQ